MSLKLVFNPFTSNLDFVDNPSSVQTPWLSNIDGGGFSLSNVLNINASGNVDVEGDLTVAASGGGGNLKVYNNFYAYGEAYFSGDVLAPTGTGEFGTISDSVGNIVWNLTSANQIYTSSGSGAINVNGKVLNGGWASDTSFSSPIVKVGSAIISSNVLQIGGNIEISGNYIGTGNSTITGTGIIPVLAGGATSGGTLTLESTTNATKGKILFGTSVYDEVHNRLGVGKTSPSYKVDVGGTAAVDEVRADMGFDMNPVLRPPAFTTTLAGLGAGNVDTGAHYYFLSYKTAFGETELSINGGGPSIGGGLSTLVTTSAGNGQVNLTVTASTDPRVTNIGVYRTPAGGVYYTNAKLVAYIANTTTTYTDNISDASLTPPDRYGAENTTANFLTVNGTRAVLLGEGQVSFGKYALTSLTTGGSNTALGAYAGSSITTGGSNTVLGYGAASGGANPYNSVAIGQWSLYQLGSISGGESVGVGHLTLFGNTSGLYNTAIGNQAGYGNATGSNSTFLGNYAGRYETGTAKLIIDSFDRSTEANNRSQALIYGISSATPANQILALGGGGKVGINTIAPTNFLDVVGGVGIRGTASLPASTPGLYLGWNGTKSSINSESQSVSGLPLDIGGQPITITDNNAGALLATFNTTGQYNTLAVSGGVFATVGFYTATGQPLQWDNGFSGMTGNGSSTSPTTSNYLSFFTDTATRLYIDGNGHVGINTTSPQQRLEVLTATGVNVALRLGKVAYTVEYFDIGRVDASGYLSIQGAQTGANSILLAPTSGNVGIGTSTPSVLLEVNGASKFDGNMVITTSTDTNPHQTLDVTGNSATGYMGAKFTNTNVVNGGVNFIMNGQYAQFECVSGGMYFSCDDNSSSIIFRTNGDTEYMRLTAAGRLGIGTASPGSKLSIVGLPTSSAGLSSGDVWVDTTGALNILKIV